MGILAERGAVSGAQAAAQPTARLARLEFDRQFRALFQGGLASRPSPFEDGHLNERAMKGVRRRPRR